MFRTLVGALAWALLVLAQGTCREGLSFTGDLAAARSSHATRQWCMQLQRFRACPMRLWGAQLGDRVGNRRDTPTGLVVCLRGGEDFSSSSWEKFPGVQQTIPGTAMTQRDEKGSMYDSEVQDDDDRGDGPVYDDTDTSEEPVPGDAGKKTGQEDSSSETSGPRLHVDPVDDPGNIEIDWESGCVCVYFLLARPWTSCSNARSRVWHCSADNLELDTGQRRSRTWALACTEGRRRQTACSSERARVSLHSFSPLPASLSHINPLPVKTEGIRRQDVTNSYIILCQRALKTWDGLLCNHL